MKILILLFILVYLGEPVWGGDKWQYYIDTHADITWNMRNRAYLDQGVSKKVAKKNDLTFLTSGLSIYPLKPCRWGYSFVSEKEVSPKEALALIQKTWGDILTEIHNNKEAIQFIAEDKEALTFPEQKIAVKITFCSLDKEKRLPPHVAQIYIVQGKAYYNFANPKTGALENPIAF